MRKLPQVSGEEVIHALQKASFVVKRQSGLSVAFDKI